MEHQFSHNKWIFLLHTFIGFIIWFLSIPGILFVIFPAYLLRRAHSIFAPSHLEFLGPEDAILSLAETSAHLNSNTAQIWRLSPGILNVSEFRALFYQCFLSTPEKRRKYRNFGARIVSWGCYTWKEVRSRIDLEKQIKLGPTDLNLVEDEDKFEEWIARWMATNDYAPEMAAWEGIILHGREKNESILLLKMDHALTDGYTWGHLASMLAGMGDKMPYLVRDHDKEISWLRKSQIFLAFPSVSTKDVFSWLRGKSVPYHCYSTPGTEKNSEWMMSLTRLDLGMVKRIKRHVGGSGVHFNTVLGSVVAGALKRWCLEEGGVTIDKLPEKVWLPNPVGWPGHPIMEKETLNGKGMGNHMSTRNQSFPFAIEDDPLHRLLDGEKSVQYAESVGQAIGFRWIVGSVGWLTPTTILRQTLAKSSPSIRSGLEQVLTPLLLSPEPHKLLGMDVIGLHLPVHVPHLLVATKLYVVPVSVGGHLEVSVSATKDAFRDQKSLNRFTKVMLSEELAKLWAKCEQDLPEKLIIH